MLIPDADAKKVLFARLLLKTPNEPFVAAMAVEPDNTGRALWIATHWIADPDVMAEQGRLKKSGADLDVLPSKADLCSRVWELTDKGMFDDRIKAAKLYAEIRGFIDKAPPVAVNVNNNRVMVIRDKGTDDEWEKGVAKQQAELINAAATRH